MRCSGFVLVVLVRERTAASPEDMWAGCMVGEGRDTAGGWKVFGCREIVGEDRVIVGDRATAGDS